MFVHICMLTQVYELLITQLHIFSINFINVLSNYRCIRYLVFPALFPSISMVFIDYMCITSVTEYSQPILEAVSGFTNPFSSNFEDNELYFLSFGVPAKPGTAKDLIEADGIRRKAVADFIDSFLV